MATSRSKSTSSRRGRQERFLRFILRRKPCYILLLVEFLVLIFLLLLLALLIWLLQKETKAVEMVEIENNWKESGEYKLSFYKCGYEPIWEHAQQMNYVPCHNMLLVGETQELYDNYRTIPLSCGGLFGAPMPFEHITSEQDVRVPQATNEMIKNHYQNKIVLSSALQIQCPRCSVRSGWYASGNKARCRRQLKTLRHGWPFLAKFCDVEEETDLNISRMIYC